MTSVSKDPTTVNVLVNAPDDASNSNHDKDSDDEYNTVFTKKLNDPELNSTLTAHPDDARSSNNLSPKCDGGASDTTDSSNSTQNDTAIKIITSNPSDTSCGYHNTFDVLERQVKLKTPLKSKQGLSLSPYSDASHGISGIANEPFDDDDQPSFLELELEARQRIKELLKNANEPRNRTLSSSSQHSQEAANREYTEFLYHVARNKKGEPYVKILPSPSKEKGNWILIFLENSLFSPCDFSIERETLCRATSSYCPKSIISPFSHAYFKTSRSPSTAGTNCFI